MNKFFIFTALLFFIFLPFFLRPENLTKRNGDFSDLVWPDYYFIKNSIDKYHQIPLWNPTVFSGIPEISNPQSPLIYPINALVLIFPIDLGIVVLIFGHFLFSGVFMIKIGKLFKWNDISCFAMTTAFTFSPFLWGKAAVGHVSQLFATLFIAPACYFGIKAFKQGGKSNYFFLSLFLSMQYLNHPTIWFYTIFFGGLTWLYFCLTEKKIKKFFFVIGAVIFSIILILPVFLIQIKTGSFITRSSLNLTDLSLPLWSIKRFLKAIFIPSNLSNDPDTETWLYFSLTAMLYAFFSFKKMAGKFKALTLIMVSVLILITLGSRTPFFKFMVDYFPFFSYLRVSTRDWFVMVFIVSLLCGFFIQKSKIRATFFLLLFLELYFFSVMRFWFVPQEMVYGKSFDFDRLLAGGDGRYYCTKRCLSARDTLPKQINTADGYHLMILKNYREQLSMAGGFSPPKYTGNIPSINDSDASPGAKALGQFSVRWVISNRQLADPGFVKKSSFKNYNLFENKYFLPRLRFKNFAENKIFQVYDSPNKITLKTEGKRDYLILADTYFPGWEVWVDGKKSELDEADGWARAVKLDEGKHFIEFKFNPIGIIFN